MPAKGFCSRDAKLSSFGFTNWSTKIEIEEKSLLLSSMRKDHKEHPYHEVQISNQSKLFVEVWKQRRAMLEIISKQNQVVQPWDGEASVFLPSVLV